MHFTSEEFGLSNFYAWEVCTNQRNSRAIRFQSLPCYLGCWIRHNCQGEWFDSADCLPRKIQRCRENCRSRVSRMSVFLRVLANNCRLIPCLRKYGIRFFAFSPLAYVTVRFSWFILILAHSISAEAFLSGRPYKIVGSTSSQVVDGISRSQLPPPIGFTVDTHLCSPLSGSSKLHLWVYA